MTGRPRHAHRGRPQGSHRVRIVVVPRDQPDLRMIARALLNLAELQATEKEKGRAEADERLPGAPEVTDE